MNSPLKPAIPITNPAFKYTPAAHTDLRKLFAKVRAELAKQSKGKKK